jgi:hypothetical protein
MFIVLYYKWSYALDSFHVVIDRLPTQLLNGEGVDFALGLCCFACSCYEATGT